MATDFAASYCASDNNRELLLLSKFLTCGAGVHRFGGEEIQREHGGPQQLPGIPQEARKGPDPGHGIC